MTSQRRQSARPRARRRHEQCSREMKVGRERRSARQRRSEKVRRRRIIILVAVLVAIPLIACGIFGVLSLGLRTVAAVQNDIPSLEDQHRSPWPRPARSSPPTAPCSPTCTARRTAPSSAANRSPSSCATRSSPSRTSASTSIRAWTSGLRPGARHQRQVAAGPPRASRPSPCSWWATSTSTARTSRSPASSTRWPWPGRSSASTPRNEILDIYLNTVYFGSNAYGIEAAAQTYFDKDPADLTLAEAALLAGLPQAPSGFSPRKHPDEALNRRNLVLNKMRESGSSPTKRLRRLCSLPWSWRPTPRTPRCRSPTWWRTSASSSSRCSARTRCSRAGCGWRPPSTPPTRSWRGGHHRHPQREGDPSAALVSIEPDTGYIRAMIGGSDYDSSKFNLAAQGRRQPGSAFKTFCLTAAIEMGIDPWTTYYESMPLELDVPGATKPGTSRPTATSTTASHRRVGHPAQRQHRLCADGP